MYAVQTRCQLQYKLSKRMNFFLNYNIKYTILRADSKALTEYDFFSFALITETFVLFA